MLNILTYGLDQALVFRFLDYLEAKFRNRVSRSGPMEVAGLRAIGVRDNDLFSDFPGVWKLSAVKALTSEFLDNFIADFLVRFSEKNTHFDSNPDTVSKLFGRFNQFLQD